MTKMMIKEQNKRKQNKNETNVRRMDVQIDRQIDRQIKIDTHVD